MVRPVIMVRIDCWERRWRAHQRLGRSTVLAKVPEQPISASLSLIENLQREG